MLDVTQRETSSLDIAGKEPPKQIDVGPKLEPIIEPGQAKVKKKSVFMSIFAPEDMSTVGNYILTDIIIPQVRDTLCNVLKDGIDAIFHGSDGVSYSGSRITNAGRVSYGKFYESRNQSNRRQQSLPEPHKRMTFAYEDVVLGHTESDKRKLNEVIDALNDVIDTYNVARVSDLNELMGVTGQWTDNDYGWHDIEDARPVHTRDGYLLKMPKPSPLDR